MDGSPLPKRIRLSVLITAENTNEEFLVEPMRSEGSNENATEVRVVAVDRPLNENATENVAASENQPVASDGVPSDLTTIATAEQPATADDNGINEIPEEGTQSAAIEAPPAAIDDPHVVPNVQHSTETLSDVPDAIIEVATVTQSTGTTDNSLNEIPTTQATEPSSSKEQQIIDSLELNERLRGLTICIVCLLMPKPEETYTCPWGHILCSTCILRILGDAVLCNRNAKCPHCRCLVSWSSISQNLPLRQILAETSFDCEFCEQKIIYRNLISHKTYDCPQRSVECKYRCIGCKWQGPYEEQACHETDCVYPRKSVEEIINEIRHIKTEDRRNFKDHAILLKQLSSMRLFYEDIHLRHHYKESSGKFYMDTHRFGALEELWQVKVRVNEDTLDVHHAPDRRVSYNLTLTSHPREELHISFFVIQSPKKALDIDLQIYNYVFDNAKRCSGYRKMPLKGINEVNKFLAVGESKIRLWMFQNVPNN